MGHDIAHDIFEKVLAGEDQAALALIISLSRRERIAIHDASMALRILTESSLSTPEP